MSNIKNRMIYGAAVFSLLAGMTLAIGNGAVLATAALTGHGGTLIEHPAQEVKLLPGDMHPGAPAENILQDAATQMFLGMLFVILGMLFYALFLIRESREVHITVKPKQERRIPTERHARQGPKWYWVEIQI